MRLMNRVLTAALLALSAASGAAASSHREAPFVTLNPKIDGTDFYMFNSYEPGRDGFVTIVANYLPLQDAYGGPNYFIMDPDALYQIHIDNNGDGREDITFNFQFRNTLRRLTVPVGGIDMPVPLINIGGIAAGANGDAALNVIEEYTIDMVLGDQYDGESSPVLRSGDNARYFRKPVDNIGNKSIPDYPAYAAQYIAGIQIPGCDTPGRVFVGQRKDPFVVNLGETFDLVNTNPLGPENGEADSLQYKNVTSFVIEVPAHCLRNGKNPIIGAWTTASLHRARVLTPEPTFGKPAASQGKWVQVSRLGMPLVNEVVIGIPDKDRFNASRPRDDGQFLLYVTHPTLPVLLNALYGVTPPCLPRNDLVAVFLTGVPGLNQPPNVTPSEMLRLNTAIPATPRATQSRLGVLGNDAAGFPNGRRPGDDVVDMSLRVVMGVLSPDAGQPNGCAPHGNLPFTDGAFVDSTFFDNAFPYLRTPVAGSPN